MPEDILVKLKKNISPQLKACFVSAVIVGLIAHMYKITNWLPNWDSLVFRYDSQNMIAMGRWFLPVVCAPSSFYDLPWLTGLLSVIFHALGAVCICKIFRVEKTATAVMIGAAVITFPTVTSVLMYNYVADGYAVAFLLSCLAAMFITNKKPNYIASVICIALSAGIYQAYITVTVMLLLCHLILESISKEVSASKLLIKTVKFLSTGIFGVALYFGIMTAMLKITGTELLEYQGIDNAGSFTGINVIESLYTVKNSFETYFFDFSKGFNVFCALNCVIFAITIVLYVIDIIKNKTSIAKLLLLLVYVALLPIGASILAFINSSVDYHNLMKMGFFVFYLFMILQYERSDVKMPRLNSVKAWTILGAVILLVFNNVIISNVSYHKLNMAYEKSYGTLIRIVDRIEQTDGAEKCDSILVVGHLDNSKAYSVNLPPDMTGTTDGYILRADDEIVGQSVLCSAINDYCGKNYSFLAGEAKDALLEQIDLDNLQVWPAANSIFTMDNVIVILLGTEV